MTSWFRLLFAAWFLAVAGAQTGRCATGAQQNPAYIWVFGIGSWAESVRGFGIHLGGSWTPRSRMLVGADYTMPLLWEFVARLHADAMFVGGPGSTPASVPVTVDLLCGGPGYGGVGLGGVLGLGSGSCADLKLVAGYTPAKPLSVEVNLHLTRHRPMVSLLARIKL